MTPTDIRTLAEQSREDTIALRRMFHRQPEISGKEYHTREKLIAEIEKLGLPYEKLPGTGLIVTIKGGKPGKHRLLRSDIDALPLQEDKENLVGPKGCVSEIDGACHACGHDAHMAMLITTMRILAAHKEEVPGTVYCCFEEGEETNCGIDTMMEALNRYTVDECFALHVYAGLDAGKINIDAGPRMAGTVGIGFTIKGKSGHGSRPDQALNPIIPAAHIITQLNSAFMNRLNVEETVTLGLGKVVAGTATNIIPETAYVGGTARFFDKGEGEKALELINVISKTTAENFGCGIEYEQRHCISPYPVVNDAGVAARVRQAVTESNGADALGACDRWFASECYSAYLNRWPGALGFLGIRNAKLGTGAPHHNGKFDIDESALPLGVCAELGFIFQSDKN